MDSALKAGGKLALANSFNRIGEAENTMAALLLCCLLPVRKWLYAVGKNKDLVDDITAKVTDT
ncbi:MAG: hypothetical protein IPM10_05590 [Chitinophagaceae bacterium]|nr:hypothetical protein [Chitinophagaceae bacterium]